jgi:hypothetical protein
MTPSLPITEADLISVRGAQALSPRPAGFPQQLRQVLMNLQECLETHDAYGPDTNLERDYICLRGWLQHHYAKVKHTLRDPRGGSGAAWSLESTAADRLYRVISPTSLRALPAGGRSWRSAVCGALERTEA